MPVVTMTENYYCHKYTMSKQPSYLVLRGQTSYSSHGAYWLELLAPALKRVWSRINSLLVFAPQGVVLKVKQ